MLGRQRHNSQDSCVDAWIVAVDETQHTTHELGDLRLLVEGVSRHLGPERTRCIETLHFSICASRHQRGVFHIYKGVGHLSGLFLFSRIQLMDEGNGKNKQTLWLTPVVSTEVVLYDIMIQGEFLALGGFVYVSSTCEDRAHCCALDDLDVTYVVVWYLVAGCAFW